MTTARRVRDLIARRGFEVRSVRGRDRWRAGIEMLWHPLDARTERVRICEARFGGRAARFLVRDLDDHIQAFHATGHFFAENELGRIAAHYRGGTFVDVGANVGNHAVFAALFLDAPAVLAFEPNPAALRILRCNLALNDLVGTVAVHPAALGEVRGRGSLGAARFDGNMGATPVTADGDDFDILVGDDILGGAEVGFIKIDVEGFELHALDGLRGTIARCRPVLMVEVDDANRAGFNRRMAEWDYVLAEEGAEGVTNANCFMIPGEG